MLPIGLQIEDFCGHEKTYIPFDSFSAALIIGNRDGDDRRSNGSGKTTIFSAIKYCLFNQIDFSTLDKVIRRGTEKCRVIFDFKSSLDNEVYRIERSKHIKLGSEVRLFKLVNNAFEDKTAATNKETEKEIAKIIKINYKTFCNSVLISQSDITNGLGSIDPSKKKLLLKEILQLNIYSKYEKYAKSKTSELIKEIEKEKVILITIGEPEADIKLFIEQIKEIENFIKEKNILLSITKKNYEKELDKYTKSSKQFEELDRLALDGASKQKQVQNDLSKIISSSKEYESKTSNINSSGQVLGKDIKEIKSILDNAITLNLRSKDLIKKDIEINAKNTIEFKSELNSFNSKLLELKIPIPNNSVCKHCRQQINDDMRKSCQSEINKEILSLETLTIEKKKIISTLEKQQKELTEEYNQVEKTEKIIYNNKQQLITKEKEIELKRSLFTEFSSLLDKNKAIILEKTKELDDLKSQQLSYNQEEYNKLKIEINNSKSKVNSLVKEIENVNKEITFLSNNFAILTSKKEQRLLDIDKILKIKGNILKLEKNYITHQQVVKAFGSNGIPALITFNILNDFQNETNILFSKLRPGLQAKFRAIKDRADGDKEDTLDIDYVLNGYELEYEQLSGAQKLLATLCLKLGLAEVLKKRLGVEMKFLLIDEADQSLDDATIEVFEDAIKDLQKEYKILIISHNKEVKEKYSNIISVEQDENLVSHAKLLENK